MERIPRINAREATDTYLFLPLSSSKMIIIKINQLIIIRVLHHFAVIGPIRVSVKSLLLFRHHSWNFNKFELVLYFVHNFCHKTRKEFFSFFADNLKRYKCYSRVKRKFKI